MQSVLKIRKDLFVVFFENPEHEGMLYTSKEVLEIADSCLSPADAAQFEYDLAHSAYGETVILDGGK